MYFFDIQVLEYYKPPSSAPPPSRSGDEKSYRRSAGVKTTEKNSKYFFLNLKVSDDSVAQRKTLT